MKVHGASITAFPPGFPALRLPPVRRLRSTALFLNSGPGRLSLPLTELFSVISTYVSSIVILHPVFFTVEPPGSPPPGFLKCLLHTSAVAPSQVSFGSKPDCGRMLAPVKSFAYLLFSFLIIHLSCQKQLATTLVVLAQSRRLREGSLQALLDSFLLDPLRS